MGGAGPGVCLLPTAAGDDLRYVAGFFNAFAQRAEATWLPLFARRHADSTATHGRRASSGPDCRPAPSAGSATA